MVAVGLTLTGVPLVTAIFPGLMTPVPPVKTAERAELPPAAMVVGFAAKLVIEGAATTVTEAVCVTGVPAAFVTVRV